MLRRSHIRKQLVQTRGPLSDSAQRIECFQQPRSLEVDLFPVEPQMIPQSGQIP